jgi:phytoene dehydrogenase-like protein
VSRVVVVGASLGGLAVAARLARLGHAVVVVERSDTVGGALAGRERDGFRWDTVPPLVTLPAALRDLFLKTGKPLESVLSLEPAEPTAHVFGTGPALEADCGAHAADDWDRVHANAARRWDTVRGPFVESAWEGRRSMRRLAMQHPRQLARIAPWRTLRHEADRMLRDPGQRQLLEHYAVSAGADPRRAPAALAVLPYVERTFRSWWVPGGLRALVDAVHDRAVLRGAVVTTGTSVTEVTTTGRRVDGVRLDDGRSLPADVVVQATDLKQRRDTSVLALLLGLRGWTPALRRHTVLFPADAEAELDALFGRRAGLVTDPTMSVFASADPTVAPAGDEAWSVFVAAPGPGVVDWDAPGVASTYAGHLLDRLADRGYDVRNRIVVSEHQVHQEPPTHRRAPMTGRVGGLFRISGSPRRAGGIPIVTMSAAMVADAVGRA